MVGLGDINSRFVVYIRNRPNYSDIPHLMNIRCVDANEIHNIGNQCGNGWRKVFNVYGKLVYELQAKMHFKGDCSSWQQWRDECLLQSDSQSLLLFSKPIVNQLETDKIHLVMGKGWADECGLSEDLFWLNQDFAVIPNQNVVVCPYFDYRQLSNQKITYLCQLLTPLVSKIEKG